MRDVRARSAGGAYDFPPTTTIRLTGLRVAIATRAGTASPVIYLQMK